MKKILYVLFALFMFAQISIAREILTGNRTYFVRTDGNDSNTGEEDNSWSAWKTATHGAEWISENLDFGPYQVTLKVGDGTYGPLLIGNVVGSSGAGLSIVGNHDYPGNVIFSATGTHAVTVYYANQVSGNVFLDGFKVTTSGSGSGLYIAGTKVKLGKIEYGSCAAYHMNIVENSYAWIVDDYTISGSALSHWMANNNVGIQAAGRTITITGTPSFTAFAEAHYCSNIMFNGATFVGSATGKRFVSDSNSNIDSFAGGISALPGNVAGSTYNGGVYIWY